MNTTGLTEDDKIKIAEKAGWTCSCISPLSLEFHEGGYATGIAANWLLNVIVENYEESELDEYLYEVKIFTKQNYIPLTIKRLSDGELLYLNEPYVDGVQTYTFRFEGIPEGQTQNYVWSDDMKIYDPQDFRVTSWTKI